MSIVTNRIERLAFDGKCRWQVFWAGLTSTYTIPVPAGGFVLLRQIIYNPYYQGETKADQIINTVHQLTLCEQGSTNELIYQFRDTLNQVQLGAAGSPPHFTPGSGQQIVETWATFKKNVTVDILNAPDSAAFVYGAPALISSDAQERRDPLGYGNIATEATVQFSGAELYYPTGEQRPFVGVPYAGVGIRDRVRFNYSSARRIQPVTAADPDRQYQYPLIGFGVWIFNIPISEYLNSGN
jgi:hypothetical protein